MRHSCRSNDDGGGGRSIKRDTLFLPETLHYKYSPRLASSSWPLLLSQSATSTCCDLYLFGGGDTPLTVGTWTDVGLGTHAVGQGGCEHGFFLSTCSSGQVPSRTAAPIVTGCRDKVARTVTNHVTINHHENQMLRSLFALGFTDLEAVGIDATHPILEEAVPPLPLLRSDTSSYNQIPTSRSPQ